jgi:transcriptional regulator with XRE-family HTH domain
MRAGSAKFGEFIRRERLAREIGLRKMAERIGVSPTYLSKIERDEFTPPTEEKVRAIAAVLETDPEELIALAGRVPADVTDIIKRQPIEMTALLRTASGLSREEITRLAEAAKRAKDE